MAILPQAKVSGSQPIIEKANGKLGVKQGPAQYGLSGPTMLTDGGKPTFTRWSNAAG